MNDENLTLAERALMRLAYEYGSWVSSASCSAEEISIARAQGRWFQIDSIGFILRKQPGPYGNQAYVPGQPVGWGDDAETLANCDIDELEKP